MTSILTALKICKSFSGVQVLKDVGFDLQAGEIHGLMGENGAGKSTLMKIIAGDYQFDSGEILFEGKPVQLKQPSDSLNLGIRLIYQEFNLVKQLTVAENICLGDYPTTWREDTGYKKSVRNFNC
jgi:ribose transport system ATP-binding protein